MNKKTIVASVLAGVLTLGGGSVYAVGQIARSNAITEEVARNFAYVDAGILPENAEVGRTEFDLKNGKFVYEIEFTADGVKYEYTVDSSNGRIIEKDSETLTTIAQNVSTPQKELPNAANNGETAQNVGETTSTEVIGIDRAKEIAVEKAGLSIEDVVFGKAKLEHDDGRMIYDIEFYITGKAEYEYEIDALSGNVLEENFEEWEADDYIEKGAVTDKQKNSEGSSAATDGQKSNNSSAPTAPKQQEAVKSDPPKQATGASAPAETTVSTEAPVAESSPEQISVDEAKSIALRRAGLSASDVVFRKAKLEHDDGRLLYDIEFYVTGQKEYEYEIDAYSGAVLDEDIELWENDDD